MRDQVLSVCPTYYIPHTSHINTYTALFALKFVDLVSTMECSTVAGAVDAASRSNGGSELAAIALAYRIIYRH